MLPRRVRSALGEPGLGSVSMNATASAISCTCCRRGRGRDLGGGGHHGVGEVQIRVARRRGRRGWRRCSAPRRWLALSMGRIGCGGETGEVGGGVGSGRAPSGRCRSG